jgi:hypothetical protein
MLAFKKGLCSLELIRCTLKLSVKFCFCPDRPTGAIILFDAQIELYVPEVGFSWIVKNIHLLFEPWCVIPCVGNIMKKKSRVSVFEFPTDV